MNSFKFVRIVVLSAFVFVIMLVPSMAGNMSGTDGDLTLWYKQPATKWREALPVGNGRLGALVFGKVADEQIILNEETIWTGSPYEPSNPKGAEAIPEIRRLIFEGKVAQAQELFGKTCMAVNRKSDHEQMKYQILGDLWFNFPGHFSATNYRRELDLETAIARVLYKVGDVHFTREIFSSPVDQIIVVRISADKPGKVSFSVKLGGRINVKWPSDEYFVTSAIDPDTLVLEGKTGEYREIEGKLRFYAQMKAFPQGGRMFMDNENEHDRLNFVGADAVTLVLAAATNFRNYKDISADPKARVEQYLSKLEGKTYHEIRKDHVAEHKRLFDRVKLTLDKTASSYLPTDERLRAFAESDDPQLAALLFQFGRYLLVCSSRPGCQPANLQGIWNGSMHPSWDCKYTTNINLEMNYWPAEVTNLSECHQPLLEMIPELAEQGRNTARLTYGAPGWVLHHNTDLWRATAPINGPYWGNWPCGGAWLCTHLWEHYLFTEEKEFLRKVYPVMKGSAEFFLETLQEHPKYKWLVTCPSSSPENAPRNAQETSSGQSASICAGPTMDMQILRYLFGSYARASEILGIDADFRRKVLKARSRLAPNQIGQHGQLQEWLEDLDSPEDHHRHFSHLWGMYPGAEISVDTTPELARAVAKSLEMRGEEGTGFGMTWQMCLWARMRDGDKAHRLLKNEVSVNTCINLFSKCFGTPQVDGTFGATAGIAEMLLQSHAGQIHLLPALPTAWSNGSVQGLCARGGFEVDIVWKDGKLTNATIRSTLGNKCEVRYGSTVVDFKTKPGKSIKLNDKLEHIHSPQ
jgi:alpha-L-fucosidase 2